MKSTEVIPTESAPVSFARRKIRTASLVAAALLGVSALLPDVMAGDDSIDDDDAEVLTRGPVHEAFASVVDYNPARGFVAPRPPPDPVPEIPPDERPDGEDVVWIPGYWAWDDEATDFIWVSGVWRVPPPGREWISGYWSEDSGDHLWISGYWADLDTSQTTYLPEPPKSLESGPNIDAPSDDYTWVPGCWIWYRSDYAWRPGYWARCRPDWVWIPAHYVWSRRGFVFIDGYWDYTATRRGVVYAPVRFHSSIYTRHGWSYSPRVCFNLGLFVDFLFLRPSCSHYYFGDYYAPRYEREGFYVSFSYYYGWHGYDPFYAHRRWEHRQDRDWERQFQATYRYRRDNESARPPDTWSAQVRITSSTTTATNRVIVAGTATQVASSDRYPVKFRKVNERERERFTDRARQVDASREQRREIEVKAAKAGRAERGDIARPQKGERPKSPIAARALDSYRGAGAPPKVEKSPEPESRAAAMTRHPNPRSQERGGPEPRNHQPEKGGRADTAAARRAQEAETKRARQEDARAKKEAQQKARQDASERATAEKDARVRKEAERNARAQEAANQKAVEAQQQRGQVESERRTRQAEAKARGQAKVKAAQEAADREKAEKQERARQQADQKARAQEAAKQKAAETQKQREQRENERRAQQAEAKARENAKAKAARDAAERDRVEKARANEESRQRAFEAQQKQQQQQKAAEQRAAEERARAEQAGRQGDTNARAERANQSQHGKSSNAKDKKDDEEKPDHPGNGNGHN